MVGMVLQISFQKVSNEGGNGWAVFFQRKMAGVEEVQLRFGQISEIGSRAGLGEEGVVLSPSDKRWWLVLAKI